MSDITQINVNGTTYNIKDANAIRTINSDTVFNVTKDASGSALSTTFTFKIVGASSKVKLSDSKLVDSTSLSNAIDVSNQIASNLTGGSPGSSSYTATQDCFVICFGYNMGRDSLKINNTVIAGTANKNLNGFSLFMTYLKTGDTLSFTAATNGEQYGYRVFGVK